MSNELLQCPYDECHLIMKCRLQKHLYRCRRSNRNSDKVACPYNIMHVMHREELESHIKKCGNPVTVDNDADIKNKPMNDMPTMTPLECEENWDDEPDYPTYNPSQYVQQAKVLRNIIGATPSIRKEFRQKERLRFLELHRNQK